MSLELFDEVPAGATEALFDAQNQPLFKQADLGKYLGIKGWNQSLGVRHPPLGGKKIPMISSLIWIILQRWLYDLKNPRQLVALIKWLTKKGVEKIQVEHQQTITDRDKQVQAHQQAIEEKDTTIALLNDDLKNREHDNVALQAQRDVYKEQLQKCQDIITHL